MRGVTGRGQRGLRRERTEQGCLKAPLHCQAPRLEDGRDGRAGRLPARAAPCLVVCERGREEPQQVRLGSSVEGIVRHGHGVKARQRVEVVCGRLRPAEAGLVRGEATGDVVEEDAEGAHANFDAALRSQRRWARAAGQRAAGSATALTHADEPPQRGPRINEQASRRQRRRKRRRRLRNSSGGVSRFVSDKSNHSSAR